jgi:glycosyltransferase involved in cell wall biosynthesis
MRILDVSPSPVYPPQRGSAVRTYNLLRHLSARHEVQQFSMPRADRFPLWPSLEEANLTPTYRELRFRHPLAHIAHRFGDRAWFKAPLLSGPALEVTRPVMLTRLLRWAEVVLVEFPWQFDYCRRRSQGRCVLASHNVESVKFSSWADAAEASLTVGPWVRYIERMEARAASRADLVRAVSAEERECYIERYGVNPERVVEIPNGADTERYAPVEPELKAAAKRRLGLPDRPTVIYAASDIPPNRRGADWVRRLAASTDHLTFLAVGEGAQVGDPPANMIATGLVDDVRPYFDAADIALCPIEHGAGTKIKLLEYMASALPSVAFAPAVAGLAARDGVEVLVAEPSVLGLREATARLADDPTLASRIGRAARKLVLERYDWHQIAHRLDDALETMVDGRPRRPQTEMRRPFA